MGGEQSDRKSEIDWDTVFLDLDLHTPNGLSCAYANFRSSESPHPTMKSSLLKYANGSQLVKQPKSFGRSRMLLNSTGTT